MLRSALSLHIFPSLLESVLIEACLLDFFLSFFLFGVVGLLLFASFLIEDLPGHRKSSS